jgi:hypothetical protein
MGGAFPKPSAEEGFGKAGFQPLPVGQQASLLSQDSAPSTFGPSGASGISRGPYSTTLPGKHDPRRGGVSSGEFNDRRDTMGALFDMKAFFRFLETATEKELSDKRERLILFIQLASDESVRDEAKYLLRKIEEELLSRL